jgi:hypothetical protein
MEGSGSVRHEVRNVTAADNFSVAAGRIVPEAGTADMADRFVFPEAAKSDTSGITEYAAYLDGSYTSEERLPGDQGETARQTARLTPAAIVRDELTEGGFTVPHIFDFGRADRRSLGGVDSGEYASVYASVLDGAVIYVTEYEFFRRPGGTQWTHPEPAAWNGIALAAAAYAAAEYLREQLGDSSRLFSFSAARFDGLERYAPVYAEPGWASVKFFLSERGLEGVSGRRRQRTIVAASPDGRSHWKIVACNDEALPRYPSTWKNTRRPGKPGPPRVFPSSAFLAADLPKEWKSPPCVPCALAGQSGYFFIR